MVFYSAHNGRTMYYRVSTEPYSIARFSKAYTVGTNTRGTLGLHVPEPAARRRPAVAAVPGRQLAAQLHDPRGALVARADARPRAALATAPRRAPRPRRTAPAVRQVRERRRAHPRDVHRGQPRGLPQLDLVRVVRPHRHLHARPAAASRDSAPRRRSGGSTASARIPATSSGRSTSPSARSGRSSSTCDGRLRPEYWWARFDGRRWRNYRITALRAHAALTGRGGRGDARSREPVDRVPLAGLTPDRRHEVEVWRTPDGGRAWTPDDDHARPGPTTCGRSARAA